MSVTPPPRAEEHTTMTDPLTPQPHDEPTPDETFTWTGDQEGDSAQGHADHGDRSVRHDALAADDGRVIRPQPNTVRRLTLPSPTARKA